MPPRKRRSPTTVLVPTGTALAKLEGRIFYDHDIVRPFTYFITKHTTTLGRSIAKSTKFDFLTAAEPEIHLGLGESNKLSRHHATIQLDVQRKSFFIRCIGKNGISVTSPSSLKTVCMSPATKPVLLESRALIQLGEAIFCFLLPIEYPNIIAKPRQWIKAESHMFRTLLVRFGYGRWSEIISAASGKLASRTPNELVPVARRFLARCFYHCHPDYFPDSKFVVEGKSMYHILRADIEVGGIETEVVEKKILQLLDEAMNNVEPDEHRRFLRWARRLRILHRLKRIVGHSSLQRLASGQLKITTPKPAPGWTEQDDVDIILGTYKYGLGQVELMRRDRQFGFHDRYLPLPPSKRGKNNSKPKSNDFPNGKEGEDHEHDEVDDEDEESENESGEGVKNVKVEPETVTQNVKSETKVKVEESVIDKGKVNEEKKDSSHAVNVKTETTKNDANDEAIKSSSDSLDDDDFMDDISSIQKNKVMFPSSEASMKRLKSVINACMKEYERDMREIKKQNEAEEKAELRKMCAEDRKKKKLEERERIKIERKRARSQAFTKKETVEFEKALANFGVFYNEGKREPELDWNRFIQNVPCFELKNVENLNAAFLEFEEETRRLVDLMAARADDNQERIKELEKISVSKLFTQLTEERAEKVLDRLAFFRTLRLEVINNPFMNQILSFCKRTRDLPVWWKSKHDSALLKGVEKYGLNAWDALFKDEEFPFNKDIQQHEEKYKNDSKMLRKGVFPKPSIAVKRALRLVKDFINNLYDQQFMRRMVKSIRMKEGDSDEDQDQEMEKRNSGNESGGGNENENPAIVDSKVLDLVDRDGHLILPHTVGDLCLVNLGDYAYEQEKHEDVLFSIGYRAVRNTKLGPMLCEIRTRPQDEQPHFRISRLKGYQTHDDRRQMWEESQVIAEGFDVQQVCNSVMGKTLASGVEMFGFYDPTIRYYVKQLPKVQYTAGDFEQANSNHRPSGIRGAMDEGVKRGRWEQQNNQQQIELPQDCVKKRRVEPPPSWRSS